MPFLMKDEEFLEKYIGVLEKVSNIINKNNSELIYNQKYLKAEKKSYNKKINRKECSQCICTCIYKKRCHILLLMT